MNRILLMVVLIMITACSKQSSEEHLASAKQHITKDNLQAATIELKNAIKQSPNSAEARFFLGKIYIEQREYQGAEKELNKALELKYSAAEIVPLLSLAYQKTRSDVALIELSHNEKGISHAQSAEIAFYKVQALFRLEQKDKAKILINEIKLLDTDSVFKQLSLVYLLVMDEEVEAAHLQLDSVLASFPSQSDALKLKALLLARDGKLETAADVYLTYLKHYPEDSEITFVAARLLVEITRTEEAEPLIDKLLAINETHGLLNQLKGIVRYNAKDMEQALLYTEKAITANPEDPAIRLIAGYAAYQLQNFEVAHQHISIIAQELPADHEALRILAASQLQLGLNDEAGDTIAALEGLTSKDNALVSSVGLALVQSGDVEKARTLLTKSESLEAESADELTRLGLLKLSLNDISGIAKLESAMDKAPTQKFTRRTLATAYLSTKQFDKALELAARWKQETGDDVQSFMLAGAVYMDQKEYRLAEKEYRQAVAIDHEFLGAQMALVEVFIQQKELSKAQQQVDAILKKTPDFVLALIKHYALAVESGEKEKAAAIALIEQQVNVEEPKQELTLLLAKVYMQEKRFNDTIDVLQNFEQKNAPQVYWQTLGQAYFRVKSFDKLTALYKQWLTLYPNQRSAVLSNLILLDNQRNYSEALTLSADYLKKNSTDNEIKVLNIHFLLATGQLESAKASLSTLTEDVKALPFVKGLIAQIQMSENNFAEALINLQAAYEARPSSRNVRLLYISLNNTGQKDKTYAFLKAHTENYPNDGESLMLLAQLQISADENSAIASYEKALTINDKNFVALNNLAYFYLDRKQHDKALEYGERALTIRPEMPDILDTVGRIHMALEDYDAAVKNLTKAVGNKDVKEEIYLNYVEALLLKGDKKLATRKLKQREYSDAKSAIRVKEIKNKYGI